MQYWYWNPVPDRPCQSTSPHSMSNPGTHSGSYSIFVIVRRAIELCLGMRLCNSTWFHVHKSGYEVIGLVPSPSHCLSSLEMRSLFSAAVGIRISCNNASVNERSSLQGAVGWAEGGA